MLTFEGWLSFISILFVIIIGCTFGLRLIYESIQKQVKLIFIAGLMIIFMSFVYLGPFIDFLTIFLTGSNLPNKEILAISSNMWTAPMILTESYVVIELIAPRYKKYFIAFTIIMCVIMEIFLFLNPLGSIRVILSQNPGEIAHFVPFVIGSPFFVVTLILSIVGIPLMIIGLLYKISQSKGIVKKKYVFLLIALSLYNISMMLFTYLPIAIVFTILNVLVFISFCFFYLGLREEPEKTKKQKPTKEVKIKDEIFRISQYRQEDITEEEVSISKEKKICLVCKGKAIGFNIFVCPNCETVYCQNCGKALSDLENACWVCNSPFDPTKPSKPITKEKDEEVKVKEKRSKEN